eukprot:scaffold23693_cov80-Skeletonema_menzelii.AAC.1
MSSVLLSLDENSSRESLLAASSPDTYRPPPLLAHLKMSDDRGWHLLIPTSWAFYISAEQGCSRES